MRDVNAGTMAHRMRELLAQPGVVPVPGAFSPMVARLIERAGFDAVYMTGSGMAAALLGQPDIGLLTMSEMVAAADSMAESVTVPVIADADTGYGNAISVLRTIRAFEKAGVAGVHLEDQAFPKRCGHFEGKRVIPKEEMVGKIRAACDVRHDPDFLIIGRSDALAVEDLAAVIQRGEAYSEAGADVLWFDAPTSLEQIQALGQHFRGVPLLFNMSSSGKTPFLTVAEVGQLGYKLMIFPIFTALTAIRAMAELLSDLKAHGDVNAIRDRCVTFEEFNELLGIDHIHALEERYSPAGWRG